MSDSDDEDGDVVMKRRRKSLILKQSNCLRDVCESFEDDKVLIVSNNNHRKVRKDVRPKSTPFRSSKGTAMFLSHLKMNRVDQFGGNLNELINAQKTAMIKSESHKNEKQNIMNRRRKIISLNPSDAIL